MSKMVNIPGNLNAATAQRLYALEVLRRHNGDRAKTSRALDVDPQTLRTWLKSLALLGVAIPLKGRPIPITPRPRGVVRLKVPRKLLATG